MAIKKNVVNEGVISDGNLTIMCVAAEEVTDISVVTATLLNGATALDVTYDLGAEGWNHTPQNEDIETPRLTLPQALSREGRQTDTLEATYAFNPELDAAATSIDEFLTPGEKYVFYARWGVDHDQDFAAGDLVDIFPVICGRKRKVAPTTGTEMQKTVTLKPSSTFLDDIAVTGA